MQTGDTGQNQSSSSSSGGGMGIMGGIFSSLNGIFGNLWSSKERRRSQEYNTTMFNMGTHANELAQQKAWERSNDYTYQMEQLKKAGINPYAIMGMSKEAQGSHAGQSGLPSQAPYHSIDPGIIPILTAMAQVKNINADTTLKETVNDQSKLNLAIDQKYKGIISEITIGNMKETQNQLNRTVELIEAQAANERRRGVTLGYESEYARIRNKYQEAMAILDQELLTNQNSESKRRIELVGVQMSHLRKSIDKLQSDIELNKENKTNIRELRPYQQRNLERGNRGILSPIEGLNQDIDSLESRSKK